jgi:hypothetical protein
MKKLFLAGVAALLMATSAHAADEEWHLHRTCTAMKAGGGDPPVIILTLDDILALQKFIPDLKKCTAFLKCVSDREAGKVKHCYENDRRWR